MSKYLSCADTAKLVRVALKKNFPNTKFSVQSSTYSMGASISVRWTDGPTTTSVDAIAKKFNGAHNEENGGDSIKMPHDSIHPITGQSVHYGADYVFTNRVFSLDFLTKVAAYVSAEWGQPVPEIVTNDGSQPYIKEDYKPVDGGHRSLRDLIMEEAYNTTAGNRANKSAATKGAGIKAELEGDTWILTGDTFIRRREIKTAGGKWDAYLKVWIYVGRVLPHAIATLCAVQPTYPIVTPILSDTDWCAALPGEEPAQSRQLLTLLPPPVKTPAPTDPLLKMAIENGAKSFKPDYFSKLDQQEQIENGLGLLIAHAFRWDGISIMKTMIVALEDANFNNEAAAIEAMVERFN